MDFPDMLNRPQAFTQNFGRAGKYIWWIFFVFVVAGVMGYCVVEVGAAWHVFFPTRTPQSVADSSTHRTPQSAADSSAQRTPQPVGQSTAQRTPQSLTKNVKYGVSLGYLNLRSGPGQNEKVLAHIPAGTHGVIMIGTCVAPTDSKSEYPFCHVKWKELDGWVSSNGLE